MSSSNATNREPAFSTSDDQPVGLTVVPAPPNVRIESIGTYLPARVRSSQEVVDGCDCGLDIPLQLATGIEQRHCVGPEESSLDLSAHAVRDCLDRSRYLPEDIDVIVCCNISKAEAGGRHFTTEPTTAIELRRRFGLTGALCFDVNNACAGVFTGIHAVNALMKAGLVRRGLVVSGEYITHLTDIAQKEIASLTDLRLACLTLGDSGIALMLDRSSDPSVGLQAIEMATISRHSDLCIAKPTCRPHGGGVMHTHSAQMAVHGIAHCTRHYRGVLAEQGWTARETEHFIGHQISKAATRHFHRQFNAISEDDTLDADTMIDTVARLGNTSTTTHTLAMQRSILDGTIANGDRTSFIVCASGLTIGTALYRFDDLPDRLRHMERTGERPDKQPDPRPHVVRQQVEQPVLAIESIGLQPADERLDSRQTAVEAGRRCLERSAFDADDIDLLLSVGVYKSDGIDEPSNAALIACELEVNHDVRPGASRSRSFVFDLNSGGLGWLQAAHLAHAQVHTGIAQRVMLTASEAEVNATIPGTDQLGLNELGTATLLHRSVHGDGFSNFHFETYEAEADAFRSHHDISTARPRFHYEVSQRYESLLVECLERTLARYLRRLSLRLEDFAGIVVPRVSESFDRSLAAKLQGMAPHADATLQLYPREQAGTNLLTSSQATGLLELRERGPRDGLVLVLAASAGIQVGCALYHLGSEHLAAR